MSDKKKREYERIQKILDEVGGFGIAESVALHFRRLTNVLVLVYGNQKLTEFIEDTGDIPDVEEVEEVSCDTLREVIGEMIRKLGKRHGHPYFRIDDPPSRLMLSIIREIAKWVVQFTDEHDHELLNLVHSEELN